MLLFGYVFLGMITYKLISKKLNYRHLLDC
jgi:hypothetical protein